MNTKKVFSLLFVTLLAAGCSGKTFEDPIGDGTVTIDRIEVTRCNTNFYTGDIYKNNLGVELTAYYTDKSTKVIDSGYTAVVGEFFSVDGFECSPNEAIKNPGKYVSSIIVSYKDGDKTYRTTKNATLQFDSVFDNLTDTCTGISLEINNSYKPGDIIINDLDYSITFNWQDHGVEIHHFTMQNSKINLSLNKGGSPIPLDEPLSRDYTYELTATYAGMSSMATIKPVLGILKVDRTDLTIDSHKMNKFYSPSSPDSKVVIVPINLWTDDPGIDLEDYTALDLPHLEELYFGDDESSANTVSFKKYYEKLNINFSGFVTDPYEVTSGMDDAQKNVLKFESVYNASRPGNGLFNCIAQAFEWVKTNYASELDWSLYDVDQNGSIDNIHFLFNYNGTAWGTSLWPHQGFTGNTKGTVVDEKVNVYCVGARNKLNNAITQIHEQGHVLGLIDYYDYTNRSASLINYIGHLDMQSDNVLDWNSYSKLVNKLVDPYVVTGTENDVSVTIGDSATTGDCLIIPADYSTWNGSAFDEYFLIELFSNKGINTLFWDNCPTLAGPKDYGVRVYHVDSRIYDMMKQQEASEDPSEWSSFLQIGTNNSSNYTAPGTGAPAEWGDFKQLTIIQKGGVDTFGDDPANPTGKYLTLDDMFYAGDSFDFNFAKAFLSKSHKDDITTMDNGETFPYTIIFDDVNKDTATIRVVKA